MNNPEIKDIRCVIFDCDGVLVDSEIIASRVSLRMLKPYGIEMDPREYARIFAGKVEDDIMRIIQEEFKIKLPDDFLGKLKLEIEHDIDHELQPIKYAKETISRIKLQKAVVSNSRLVRVLHSLKVAGLTEIFDKNIFSAEMVERPKPFPDVYLHAAKTLKVDPKNCLVIEDSISGVTAASRAGMNVVGFLGASHIHEGHDIAVKESGAFTTIANMNELSEFLDNIIR